MGKAFLSVLTLFFVGQGVYAEQVAKTQESVNVCIPQFREEFATVTLMSALQHEIFEKHNLKVNVVAAPGKVNKAPGLFDRDLKKSRDFTVVKHMAEKEGNCDFGVTTVESVFAASNAQVSKIKPLLFSMYGQGYDTAILVKKDSGIKSVADLKGKSIRIGHVPTQIAISKLIEKQKGMKLADLDVRRSISTNTSRLFDDGTFSAVISYVPLMPILLAKGNAVVLEDNLIRDHVMEKIPHSVFVVSKNVAKKKAKAVENFVKAIREANELINKNPSEAIYAYNHMDSVASKGAASRRGEFKTTVSPVVAEKAAQFVGQLHMIGPDALVEFKGQKLPISTIAKKYWQLLKDNKFQVTNFNEQFFKSSTQSVAAH